MVTREDNDYRLIQLLADQTTYKTHWLRNEQVVKPQQNFHVYILVTGLLSSFHNTATCIWPDVLKPN